MMPTVVILAILPGQKHILLGRGGRWLGGEGAIALLPLSLLDIQPFQQATEIRFLDAVTYPLQSPPNRLPIRLISPQIYP